MELIQPRARGHTLTAPQKLGRALSDTLSLRTSRKNQPCPMHLDPRLLNPGTDR